MKNSRIKKWIVLGLFITIGAPRSFAQKDAIDEKMIEMSKDSAKISAIIQDFETFHTGGDLDSIKPLLKKELRDVFMVENLKTELKGDPISKYFESKPALFKIIGGINVSKIKNEMNALVHVEYDSGDRKAIRSYFFISEAGEWKLTFVAPSKLDAFFLREELSLAAPKN